MTRSRRRTTTWGAAVTALLLVGAGAPASAAPGVATAAAEPVTVLSNDFEDGSVAPWGPRGPVELAVTTADAHTGTSSLSVTGRTADWQGPATDALAILDPGVEYTVSAWVKLAPGTAGTSQVHFSVEQAPFTSDADHWVWVGGATPVTAGEWTLVQGTYTLPEGLTAASLYLEASGIDGVAPQLLVDDVAVTGVPAATDEVVVATDFDDGTWDPWTQSGGPTLSVVDVDGDPALLVANRTNDYDGIQSPAGILEPGVEHTFSMRVRLAEGTEGTTSARFVVKPTYSWVGNAQVSADAWTTITGTYTPAADAGPAELGVYIGTDALAAPYGYLVDDIVITRPLGDDGGSGGGGDGGGTPVDLSFDFEDGLQGWVARDAGGSPSVDVTTAEAHSGTQAALVSERAGQGDGIGYDLTGVVSPGQTIEVTAWVKMAAGVPQDSIWLSAQRTTGGAQAFDTIGQFDAVPSSQWREVTATYTVPADTTSLFLYFETSYNTGSSGDFLVDDVRIASQSDAVVQDLTPIQDTVPWPVGAAIDSRETTGAAAELLLRHFDQVTPENHMKPEAFYDAPWSFRVHPEALAVMDFAQENDLGVYGHVLVWHSQTPEWFFADDAGVPLTTSEADQQVLRDRMRTHIFAVAEALAAEYGAFGSETNPLVAWDVVNEVVSDSGEFSDGLRRSEWYRILGEEFIDLAFVYADEAFNDVYAAEGVERPVTLFINDYNTEQGGKQDRYYALVERLLARDVPIDGVGHQFHVSLSTPVSALDATLDRFAALGLTQVVTELDVTVGTPVTEANLVEQGYWYRDAFDVFREHAANLYSVTVWGLTDNRSWRSTQAPLVFDGALQAKPAYYGVVDGELPARQRTAFVFGGDVALDDTAADSPEWDRLPLHAVEETADFQLRWAGDHLTAYVQVADATVDATDAVELQVGDTTYVVGRDGTSDVPAVVTEVDGGWVLVAHLPLDAPAEGAQVMFDLRVTDGATTVGWNRPGALGTLTLVEPLSFTEVVQATTAPEVDGAVDAAWSDANAITTDTQVMGTGGATATVRTLWQGDTLYVLAEVADPVLDATGSDPWQQDSVEFFLDTGNVKNGPYRYDDTQIRISYLNQVSFGTGDEAFQAARVDSATAVVDGGYVVEAAISLLDDGGLGTFHGFDAQVNDAEAGARTTIRTWADPTGLGYQSTARWGVAELVGPAEPPFVPDPAMVVEGHPVHPGTAVDVELTGWFPGSTVELALERTRGPRSEVVPVGTAVAGADGSVTVALTVPGSTAPGRWTLVATSGDLGVEQDVTVTGRPAGDRGGNGDPRVR